MSATTTISRYLIDRLHSYGVRHIFGVPGDYVLGFYKELEESRLKVINTCDEQGAGFAADAYARVNGMGAVCVTYCVGGLKVANTTAQAFAEKSPVVVISGAPGTNEQVKTPLLHHMVRNFDTQLKVFELLTVASTVLDDPQAACREIDRVLGAAFQQKRPVYIELPRNMVSAPVSPPLLSPEEKKACDPGTLNEALEEAVAFINRAEKPLILAGVEVHRYGLQDLLSRLLVKTGIPVVSTVLSKSVIAENHARYLGVYEGAMGREEVREYVESSDCLIILGAFMTDLNLGIFTARLEQSRSIYATSEKLAIRYHSYEGVDLETFMGGLLQSELRSREDIGVSPPPPPPRPNPFSEKPITVNYLFQRLNAFIDARTVVIADPGDAMFAAIDMTIHGETEFLAPAYYASLGFAVPASIGVQMARPDLRSLVLVGDGAFQMSGMELSTVARFHLNPIIVVLNNGGYGTERPMLDGRFNDVHPWSFSRIPDVLDAGRGFVVKTEAQLEKALEEARKSTDSFCILDVNLDKDDRSMALQRLTKALGERIKHKEGN